MITSNPTSVMPSYTIKSLPTETDFQLWTSKLDKSYMSKLSTFKPPVDEIHGKMAMYFFILLPFYKV